LSIFFFFFPFSFSPISTWLGCEFSNSELFHIFVHWFINMSYRWRRVHDVWCIWYAFLHLYMYYTKAGYMYVCAWVCVCVWERIINSNPDSTTPSHSPASRNVSNIVISLGLVSSSGCPWNNKLLSDYYKWSYTIYNIISLRHCELIYNGVYRGDGIELSMRVGYVRTHNNKKL